MASAARPDRPLRPLRRPVRPRGADRGARRAGRGATARRWPTRVVPGRVRPAAARLRRHAVAALPTPSGSPPTAAPRILLKREDLNHTGAHKVRNVLGQALLTKRMGKPRVIAETGAGQHGVASATAAALLDLECVVYMGEVDTERQALNVARMRMLGATVVPVTTGSRTLKDAINEALRDWVTNVDDTHYLLGTAAGPHPFPAMVRDFVRGIGVEARAAVPRPDRRGCPTRSRACVGGGSNAIGIFHAFVPRRRRAAVRLRGRRRRRRDRPARGAASPAAPPACCTAPAPTCCRTTTARPSSRTRSRPAWTTRASARSTPGCTTPAGRRYEPVTDAEAMDAFQLLCRTEGIIPAIESAHALAGALRIVPALTAELGRDADDRGQPVRPRRQGRAHRRRLLRHPRQGAVPMSRDRGGLRQGPGRGAGAAGRLPAGRVPDRRRQHRRDAGHGRGRRRRRRGRLPVLRPGDGRPGHPAGQRHRAGRRRTHRATCCAPSRRSPAPARRWWS